MTAISSYRILEATNARDLGEMVRQEIRAGWIPYGSFVIDSTALDQLHRNAVRFYQPMVKLTGGEP